MKKRVILLSVTLLVLLIMSSPVYADMIVPITPQNLPRSNATLTFSYIGTDVTSLTVTTPDGRALTSTPDPEGTIKVYLGNAPAGTYKLSATGTLDTFSVMISGDPVTASTDPLQTPVPTVTPTPLPTPIPSTTSTMIPTPKPTPTPEPTVAATPTPSVPPVTVTKVPTPTSSPPTPLPIIAGETQVTDPSGEDGSKVPSKTIPDHHDNVFERIPTPQILIETKSFFSLFLIYAAIPLTAGFALGWGGYSAFGFYAQYNRRKKKIRQQEENGDFC